MTAHDHAGPPAREQAGQMAREQGGTTAREQGGTTAHEQGARTRMPRRDRWWARSEALRVVGPFTGVTAAGVRDALLRWYRADPTCPALSRPDARGYFAHLSPAEFAARCRDSVVELDVSGPGAAHAVCRRLIDEPRGDRPLLVVLAGGFVGLALSHTVGDGNVTNSLLLPGLIRAAASGGTPPPLPSSSRLPLTRAMLRHLGTRPGRLPRALRLDRQPLIPPDSGPLVPWKPDVDVYATRMPAQVLRDLRPWRDARYPGVSMATLMYCALAAALVRVGLGCDRPGATVMVDARRYLPPGARLTGNFSWVLYVRSPDLTDPRAVHEAMREGLDSGNVLALLAMRDLHAMLVRPGSSGPPPRVRARPLPELRFNNTGRLSALDDLPWAGDPEQRRTIAVPFPRGPEDVVFGMAELAGMLHVNATFHRSTFDPAAIARAVDLACTRPFDLF